MQYTRRRKILMSFANGMVFLVIFVIVLIWGPGRQDMVPTTSAETQQESPVAGYTGSLSCRECHERFHGLWETSHHGRAMQPYTAELARTELTPQTEEIVIGEYRYLADIDEQRGWVYEYGPGWALLTGDTPENIACGDVSGDGKKDVIGDFGTLGIWVYY